MGEMSGWSVGDRVDVWVEDFAHGPVPVPSEVVGIFDREALVQVRVGSDRIGMRGAAPILCFPMPKTDIDQSGHCAFDIVDFAEEPK
jgi:hypothetical protein